MRTRRPSRVIWLFSSAVLITHLAACADAPSSLDSQPPSAAELAQGFDRIADSVSRASGPTAGEPFRGAAHVIRLLGRTTTIKILIDGTPTTFEAVAQRVVFPPARCNVPAIALDTAAMPPRLPVECFASLGAPMLIAWETQPPRRMLFIHADTGTSTFGLPAFGTGPPSDSAKRPTVLPRMPASASLFDQNGRFWLASAGTVTQSVVATKALCVAQTQFQTMFPQPSVTCVIADFKLAFDARVDPPPVARPGTPVASSSHTLSMPAQSIVGAEITVALLPADTAKRPPIDSTKRPPIDSTKRPPIDSTKRPPIDSTKPPPIDSTKRPPIDSTKRPPIDSTRPPSPIGLLSSLAVSVDSGVTFHFKVHNPGPNPIVLDFPTSQLYDFMIRDVGMHDVWRWSVGRAFAAMPHRLTLGPGESKVFSERWSAPAAHGRFLAVARLASTNYGVEQWIPVSIP